MARREFSGATRGEYGFFAGSGAPVWFQVVDGLAVSDDVVLGPLERVRFEGVRPLVVRASRGGGPIRDDAREAADVATRWPDAAVPFEYASTYPDGGRDVIEYALRMVERRTALRFFPRTVEPDAIQIVAGSGCYSVVGQAGGLQAISLASGCVDPTVPGIVAHEFMHALGWAHEQSRADRDQYVRYHPENVQPTYAYNFDVLAASDDDHWGPYDFDSVMHYGARDFSANQGVVLEPLDPSVPLGRLGARCGLSVGDVSSLRATYPGAPANALVVDLPVAQLSVGPRAWGPVLLVDVGGTAEQLQGATLTLRSSDPEVLTVAGRGAGLARLRDCGGQLRFRLVGLPRTGTTTLTIELQTGAGERASASARFTVGPNGAGTPLTNAPGAYSPTAYYYFGDRVIWKGVTWQNVTTGRGNDGVEPLGAEWTHGRDCEPGSCTDGSRFVIAADAGCVANSTCSRWAFLAGYSEVDVFWVPVEASPEPLVVGLFEPSPVDAGRGDAGLASLDAGTTPGTGTGGVDASVWGIDAGLPSLDAGTAPGTGTGGVDASVWVIDAGPWDAGTSGALDAGVDRWEMDGGIAPPDAGGWPDVVTEPEAGARTPLEPVVGACASTGQGPLLTLGWLLVAGLRRRRVVVSGGHHDC